MKIPLRFPIGVKLASVSIVILLMAMVPSAMKTSSIFKSVSGKQEESSNSDQANSRANEVTVTLEKIIEKVTFYGPLILAANSTDKGTERSFGFLKASFLRDPDIVSIEIKSRDKATKFGERMVNDAYLKGYRLDADYLRQVDKERPFAGQEAFDGEVAVRNRSLLKGAPLLTIAVPLAKDPQGRVTHIALANVRLNSIQKAFADKGARIVYLIDKKGVVYGHPDEKLAMEGATLKGLKIVDRAITSAVSKGQLRYMKKDVKEYFISAFSRTPYGLTVISEASERIILEPAEDVERQVYFITCIVLSSALFFVFLLSLTITRPINRLVLITKEIARGNFGISVARQITSNDEVGTLAVSFDAMLAGLRERDKVKSLFSKFHGSTVTESLLATEQVATGGLRKKVVVFFSDIRGFTAISENSSPEQVVSMVNEYFTIMVRIILANHGIVDKFIGDAIMAIWGTPKGTDQDTNHAVKACLEMRQALAELNAKRIARGEQPLMIGMGLHTGEAISGNIGSEERMEFTVIGDTVNMASRIEASTKAFGSDLLLSEDVANEVKDKFLLAVCGSTKVKGKAQAIKLYKVNGIIDAAGQEHIIKTPYSEYQAEHVDKVEIVS